MPLQTNLISPCLWFDTQALEAAELYTSIFPNSRLGQMTYFAKAGQELHGREPGSIMTVAYELDGSTFTALNGGPMFKFSEAISLQVNCESQDEIDHYWSHLGEGGDPAAQQCGWLKDRFGVSWQIVPQALQQILACGDAERIERVMTTLFTMKMIDIAALEKA